MQGLRVIGYMIFILMLGSSAPSAYETCKTSGGKDIKWNNSKATYLINDSGGPSGTDVAILDGMQAWTDVATSEFIFHYGGTTTNTAHGSNDGSNIVTFGIITDENGDPLPNVLAENRYWYFTSSGNLIDSDIRFNTYYSWSTTGASGVYDVQNVGTHEHGHSLCLKDLYGGIDYEKTMYFQATSGETKKQTLDQDDIDGITYLYTCSNWPVRIFGTGSEYLFLQDAYDDSENYDIILSQATVFTEDLSMDVSGKSVTMEGGYNCDYGEITGITTLKGNMTISEGSIVFENFEVQ